MEEKKNKYLKAPFDIPVSALIGLDKHNNVVEEKYEYMTIDTDEKFEKLAELYVPYVKAKLAEKGVYIERKTETERQG